MLGALTEAGAYRGSERRGAAVPIPLHELFAGIPEFYVQTDWSSQPTMMQVAGGMDRLPAALAARLGFDEGDLEERARSALRAVS